MSEEGEINTHPKGNSDGLRFLPRKKLVVDVFFWIKKNRKLFGSYTLNCCIGLKKLGFFTKKLRARRSAKNIPAKRWFCDSYAVMRVFFQAASC